LGIGQVAGCGLRALDLDKLQYMTSS